MTLVLRQQLLVSCIHQDPDFTLNLMHQGQTSFLSLVPNLGHFCSVDFYLAVDMCPVLGSRLKFCLLIDRLNKSIRMTTERRIWKVQDAVEKMWVTYLLDQFRNLTAQLTLILFIF